MKSFTAPLRDLEEFTQIRSRLKKNQGVVQVTGCIESQKSHLMYCAGEDYKRRLIITYSDLRAREIYENYRFYQKNVWLYPARDLMFYSADIQSHQIGTQRMMALRALLEEEEVTVITTMAACMEHILPLSYMEERILTFRNDSTVKLQELSARLVEMGYEMVSQVESVGQFAVRGGIIDIFPLTEENPIRMELWGDEVDSLRSFDCESQRSIENLETIRIYPANEVLISEEQACEAVKKIEKEGKKQEQVFRSSMQTEEAAHVKNLVSEIRESCWN